uniref:Uncharacterized protein n=1 Tax=uncultured prokaryote TaxID=198431 RepID=A0A0H5Q528_9ZZZZ|nr:hypothetical protein [uncultured prokaryote]
MKENIIKEIANYNIEEDIEKAFPNVWRDLSQLDKTYLTLFMTDQKKSG